MWTWKNQDFLVNRSSSSDQPTLELPHTHCCFPLCVSASMLNAQTDSFQDFEKEKEGHVKQLQAPLHLHMMQCQHYHAIN